MLLHVKFDNFSFVIVEHGGNSVVFVIYLAN